MPVVDLDSGNFHVTLKDWLTGQPWIDPSTGRTSQDLPYESGEWSDVGYEPKGANRSSVKVTFPSYLVRPELRGVLDHLWDAKGIEIPHRVEIYKDQPDVGDPVFGGFIAIGGVTQKGGTVTIDVQDSLAALGTWQSLEQIEEFNTTPDGLYTRAMSHWLDIVNEDFSNPAGIVASYNTVTAAHLRQGQFFSEDGSGGAVEIDTKTAYPLADGDTWLYEVDLDLNCTPSNASTQAQVYVCVNKNIGNGVENTFQFAFYGSNVSTVATPTPNMNFTCSLTPLSPVVNLVVQPQNYAAMLDNPKVGRLAVLVKYALHPQVLTVSAFFNNESVLAPTAYPYTPSTITTVTPGIQLTSGVAGDHAYVTGWRVRKLVPWINRAARFHPQTAENIYYPPNAETLKSFLDFVALLDNAEYRVLYRRYPQPDELELDQLGTLGTDASARLGYGQPSGTGLPTPAVTPGTTVTEKGSFAALPPFRFEEGHNLVDFPQVNTPAVPFANEITYTGSGTQGGQVFVGVHSVPDTGNPQQAIAPVRPYVEILSSDKRAGIVQIASMLAANDLQHRTDPTPSLTLKVTADTSFGMPRSLDSARVITKSLIRNVDQSLRIMSVRRTFGSASCDVVVGKGMLDPGTLRRLKELAVQSLLYDRSGGDFNDYLYVYVPATLASFGSPSTAMTILLDEHNSGSAIQRMTLSWATDGSGGVPVGLVQPVIDGQAGPLPTNPVTSTYSGPVDVTGFLNGFGPHTLAFQNIGGATTVLVAAHLIYQLKV